MADRLIGICTSPNGEGVWWPAKSVDEGCIQTCDCQPKFYVAAPAIEQEVERLEEQRDHLQTLGNNAGNNAVGRAVEAADKAAAMAYGNAADCLRSLLQDGEQSQPQSTGEK